MTGHIHRLRCFAPVGLSLALCSVALSAQSVQSGQPGWISREAAEIPSRADAPLEANRLLSAFHNRAALDRVALLEEANASPALDPPAATALLREALHDRDPLVREAALRALIGRDTVENPVVSEQDARPFKGREGELARVHFAVKREDHSALRELIESGDAAVQESAFEELAGYDAASAAEVLHAELRDSHSPYRLQTLELLARSSHTNSWDQLLPTLQELSGDQDPLVSAYAQQLLGTHGVAPEHAPETPTQ